MKTQIAIITLLLTGSLMLQAQTPVVKNTIDIYVAPSAAEITWDSPKDLLRTFKNSLKATGKHQTSFGHGLFVADCTTLTGEKFQMSSSMDGVEADTFTQYSLLIKQDGFKFLFKDLAPGRLISQKTNNVFLKGMHRTEATLSGKTEKLYSRFLRLNVSPEKCSMAQDYFNTFRHSKSLKFGFAQDPYEQYQNKETDLGAGCTSFIAGLVKVLGVWDETLDQAFVKRIDISKDWLGDKKSNVKIFKKINSPDGSSWASPGKETVNFKLYDPELMWDFLDSGNSCLFQNDELFANACSGLALQWLHSVGGKPVTTPREGSSLFYGIEFDAK